MVDANYFCQFQVISEDIVHSSFFEKRYQQIWVRLYNISHQLIPNPFALYRRVIFVIVLLDSRVSPFQWVTEFKSGSAERAFL